MADVERLIDYNRYLLKLKHLRDRDLPLSAIDDDWCSSKGGHWVTIKGNHICILEGETPEEAFERQTGKKFEEPKPKKPKRNVEVGPNVANPRNAKTRVSRIINELPEKDIEGIDNFRVKKELGTFEWTHPDLGTYNSEIAGQYFEGGGIQRTVIEVREDSMVTLMHGREILYHEVGHHVHAQKLTGSQRREWRSYCKDNKHKMPSDYAKRNAGEAFAECYMTKRIFESKSPRHIPRLKREVDAKLNELLGG